MNYKKYIYILPILFYLIIFFFRILLLVVFLSSHVRYHYELMNLDSEYGSLSLTIV